MAMTVVALRKIVFTGFLKKINQWDGRRVARPARYLPQSKISLSHDLCLRLP